MFKCLRERRNKKKSNFLSPSPWWRFGEDSPRPAFPGSRAVSPLPPHCPGREGAPFPAPLPRAALAVETLPRSNFMADC